MDWPFRRRILYFQRIFFYKYYTCSKQLSKWKKHCDDEKWCWHHKHTNSKFRTLLWYNLTSLCGTSISKLAECSPLLLTCALWPISPHFSQSPIDIAEKEIDCACLRWRVRLLARHIFHFHGANCRRRDKSTGRDIGLPMIKSNDAITSRRTTQRFGVTRL